MSIHDKKSLRYGDLCPRCNAASGIDPCPTGAKDCPLDLGDEPLPKDYYPPRSAVPPVAAQQPSLAAITAAAQELADAVGAHDNQGMPWQYVRLHREKLLSALKGLPTPPSAIGTKHWVYAAAEKHRLLVENLTMGDKKTESQHVAWMLDQIPGMSPTKACRWLGWIQASLYVDGLATLDELKAINRSASADGKAK